MTWLTAREFDAAVLELRRAAALAPESPLVIQALRALNVDVGPEAASEPPSQILVDMDPRLHEAAVALARRAAGRLGRLLWQDGRFTEAALLLQLAAEEGGSASTWFDLGLARQDLRDFSGAEEAYSKALAGHPEHVAAAFNLGLVLQQQGKWDLATKFYGVAYKLQGSMFGSIITAMAAGPHGRLWLDSDNLRRILAE